MFDLIAVDLNPESLLDFDRAFQLRLDCDIERVQMHRSLQRNSPPGKVIMNGMRLNGDSRPGGKIQEKQSEGQNPRK